MHPKQLQLTRGFTSRHRVAGMALPVVLIALFVFSVIMFGISRQQVHETRWTASALERNKAFVLADAGMQRAVARHVARKYGRRWYGATPTDDQLGAANQIHVGRFNESSQLLDETGAGGAPSGDQRLEPNGTYSTYVEDFTFDQDTAPAAGASPATTLTWTDVISKGTLDGPGGHVSAVVFARIAICPQVPFFDPTGDEPENIKKVIRYKVYFEPAVTDRDYLQPGPDTQALQNRVSEEVATYHLNFLRNRQLFSALHQQVNATWNAPAAGKFTYTNAEIQAMFAGLPPVETVTLSSSDPQAFNFFAEYMIRNYQVSDLLGPNQGFRYQILPADMPSTEEDTIAKNILAAFALGDLAEIPSDLKPDSTNPVTTGARLLELTGADTTSALAMERTTWSTKVSSWTRRSAVANIIDGHFIPFPTPTTTDTAQLATERARAATGYEDAPFFVSKFTTPNGASPATVTEMRAEITRIETFAGREIYGDDTIKATAFNEYFDIVLKSDSPSEVSSPAIPVNELVHLYYKYISSRAQFLNGNPSTITPPPAPPPPPDDLPKNNSGNGANGGGGGGSGGNPYARGRTIGGRRAGL